MDLRDLKYFRAVAEHGSYSRAAAVLRISQPALSRAVQRRDLEVTLLERHGHGARLTEAGGVLAERADALLQQLDRMRSEIQHGADEPSGVLEFAVPPGAATYLVPPVVEAFHARYPRVFLRIRGGFSGQLSDWVLRGQVDLACIHDPAPMRGVKLTPLVSEEIFLVGRDTGVGSRRRYARIEDLARIPLVLPGREHSLRRLVERRAGELGIETNVRTEVDGQPIIKLLLRRGVGCSLLTRGAIADEVARGELEARPFRPRFEWPLVLVERVGAPASSARDALVGAVRETCIELTGSGEWPGRSLDRGG